MASVTIHLPSVMDPIVNGTRKVVVDAQSIKAALDALVALHPELEVHLFDETGSFRTHVLCFLNDTNTRWLSSLEETVKDGDELTILQAVSGG